LNGRGPFNPALPGGGGIFSNTLNIDPA